MKLPKILKFDELKKAYASSVVTLDEQGWDKNSNTIIRTVMDWSESAFIAFENYTTLLRAGWYMGIGNFVTPKVIRFPEFMNSLVLKKTEAYPMRDDIKSPFKELHIDFDTPIPESRSGGSLFLTGVSISVGPNKLELELNNAIMAVFHYLEIEDKEISVIDRDSKPRKIKTTHSYQAVAMAIQSFTKEGVDSGKFIFGKESNHHIVRNIIDFLALESITLEKQDFKKLNKKRIKKGKKPKTEYHIINWSDVKCTKTSRSTESGIVHTVRYDVRGHWRRLSKGRRVWVRPHLKGPVDAPYRPKGYRVQ